MISLMIPDCLHIPPLREGESASISWGEVDNADGYVLERQFNETFEAALTGRTWASLDAESKTWTQIALDGLSWEQFEALPTLGRTWGNMDCLGLGWDQIETQDLTWDQWALQPPSQEIYRGPGTAEAEQRRSAMDAIPIGARTAIYRVAAYDGGGQSDFLSSDMTPVIPIFDRENTLQWPVNKGEHTYLFIWGSQLQDTEHVPLTFRYDTGVLSLEDFAAHISGTQTEAGRYPLVRLNILESVPGRIRFKRVGSPEPGEYWSGCITVVHFIARRTGLAEAQLQ